MTQAHHKTKSQWLAYMTNQLPETEREQYEDHLYTCDECLGLYMECLDEAHLPSGPECVEHVDATETSQSHQPAATPLIKARPFFRQVWFHYTAAACITLLLMSSGAFSQIVRKSAEWNTSSFVKQERSVSDQLMKKTASLLNLIHPSIKGGSVRE
ncbi:MAG: hypothetical protein ACM32O_08305 [Clostridia bacterium]